MSLWRHKRACHSNLDPPESTVGAHIRIDGNGNRVILNDHSRHTVVQQTHVTMNIVNIVGFGIEDMSKLERLSDYTDVMNRIVRRKSETYTPVVECARYKHFNPKLPEFRNLRHKNASKDQVWVHDGSKWIVRPLSEVQIEMMVAGADMMADFIVKSHPSGVSPSLWSTVPRVNMSRATYRKCEGAGRLEPPLDFHPSRLQEMVRCVRQQIANMILNETRSGGSSG